MVRGKLSAAGGTQGITVAAPLEFAGASHMAAPVHGFRHGLHQNEAKKVWYLT
jgi:hypothetical protein